MASSKPSEPATKTDTKNVSKNKPNGKVDAKKVDAKKVDAKKVDAKKGGVKTSSDKPDSGKPDSGLASSNEVSAFFSRVQIVAQYLKDLSFESPNAPQIFSHGEGTAPSFSLDLNVKPQQLAPQRHEVNLVLKVAMQRGSEVCFLVELIYAGLVAVPEDADEHPLLQPLLLIEIPRLLFPYARNILSELTQSSGFPPLVVQPVDFAALYRKHLEAAAAAQKKS